MSFLRISSFCLGLFSFTASGLWAQDPILSTLLRGQPVTEQALTQAIQRDSKNTAYYQMLQAFALLSKGNLSSQQLQAAKSNLEQADLSFNDLKDADNFSVLFSSDEKSIYRGRPHERVMTAMMLGILDMYEGRCDMALPALKDAEFLDARWQKVSYGSDAPMVYALMLRCAYETQAGETDVTYAKEGLHRSMRLILAQEPITAMFRESLKLQIRQGSLAVRLAQVLYEAGIATALMTAPINATASILYEKAAKEADYLVTVIKTQFETQQEEIFSKMAKAISQVEGENPAQIESFSYALLSKELSQITEVLKKLSSNNAALKIKTEEALSRTRQLAQQVEGAVKQDRLVLRFQGKGPSIVREGQYQEIARVVPSKDGSYEARIQEKPFFLSQGCGFHRETDGSLTIVLCKKNLAATSTASSFKGVELWSSTFQATSIMGRRFDKILKGRAQFRATTENIAVVSGAAALMLLDAGLNSQGTNRDVLLGASAVAGLIAGISFAAGRASNPAADPRYIPSLYESGYILLPESLR